MTHRWPYPPDKGDRIRAFGLLRQLSRHFTVDLLSLCPVSPSRQHFEAISAITNRSRALPQKRWPGARAALPAIISGQSITQRAFFDRGYERTLAAWLFDRRYAAVLAVCSSVAGYMLKHPSVPLVVDFVDADSAKWATLAEYRHCLGRWLLARESRRLAGLEGRLLDQARFSIAVSKVEANILQQLSPSANLLVAQNGVDTDFFCPPETKVAPKHISFVGQMDYEPNIQAVIWLAKHVWPAIKVGRPGCEFRIVGRNPSRQVNALKRYEGIRVLGAVTDVRPFLYDAVAVAPLQIARGIQNKVLEAMACGLPVVASPAAVQGISSAGALPLLVAESPDDWIAAVCGLLENSPRSLALGREARQFVLEHYTWPHALDPLIEGLFRIAAT